MPEQNTEETEELIQKAEALTRQAALEYAHKRERIAELYEKAGQPLIGKIHRDEAKRLRDSGGLEGMM
jgi:hypothetical protein